MKNKDLIKALLEHPMDSEVYVAGFDGATGERNWDGGVETLRTDGQNNIYVEFNELFLDNHEEMECERTLHGGIMVRADRIKAGDVIDAEPIFDYYERNGEKFDEADRASAQAEFEVVDHAYRHAEHAYINMVGGETHVLPCYFEIEVTNA